MIKTLEFQEIVSQFHFQLSSGARASLHVNDQLVINCNDSHAPFLKFGSCSNENSKLNLIFDKELKFQHHHDHDHGTFQNFLKYAHLENTSSSSELRLLSDLQLV